MFTRVKTTLCALLAIGMLGLAGNFAPAQAQVQTKATTAAIRFDTKKFPKDRAIVDGDRASFPNLRGDYEVLQPGGGNYNCIAWSLGITDRWVWPGKTVADFDKLNAKYGYKRLKTPDLRVARGVDKIALYGLVKGGKWEATHQARQHTDGTWTSKLGHLALIRHHTLDAVSGPTYGQAAYVYVRQSR
jgi:type VI secretion system secreted protein VgrG